MLKSCLGVCVCVASLFLVTREGASQEIVHALTGSVSSINTADGTITLLQDGGSKGTFKVISSSKTHIAFDKKVAEDAVAANGFGKQGAYVIVFYFGIRREQDCRRCEESRGGPVFIDNWRRREMEWARSHALSERQRRRPALFQGRRENSGGDIHGSRRWIEIRYRRGRSRTAGEFNEERDPDCALHQTEISSEIRTPRGLRNVQSSDGWPLVCFANKDPPVRELG